MVTRNKPAPEPVLKSWGEVEDALGEIKNIENFIIKTEAYYDSRIAEIKTELSLKLEDKLRRKVRLEKDIQEYAEVHKDEVRSDKMQKTKEFMNGLVGFRWKPWSIVLAKKRDEVIALLKKKKLDRWIRTKEEVDKEAVTKDFDSNKADDKKLSSVGLKRERKEEFWYCTDKAKAVSAEADAERVHT